MASIVSLQVTIVVCRWLFVDTKYLRGLTGHAIRQQSPNRSNQCLCFTIAPYSTSFNMQLKSSFLIITLLLVSSRYVHSKPRNDGHLCIKEARYSPPITETQQFELGGVTKGLNKENPSGSGYCALHVAPYLKRLARSEPYGIIHDYLDLGYGELDANSSYCFSRRMKVSIRYECLNISITLSDWPALDSSSMEISTEGYPLFEQYENETFDIGSSFFHCDSVTIILRQREPARPLRADIFQLVLGNLTVKTFRGTIWSQYTNEHESICDRWCRGCESIMIHIQVGLFILVVISVCCTCLRSCCKKATPS